MRLARGRRVERITTLKQATQALKSSEWIASILNRDADGDESAAEEKTLLLKAFGDLDDERYFETAVKSYTDAAASVYTTEQLEAVTKTFEADVAEAVAKRAPVAKSVLRQDEVRAACNRIEDRMVAMIKSIAPAAGNAEEYAQEIVDQIAKALFDPRVFDSPGSIEDILKLADTENEIMKRVAEVWTRAVAKAYADAAMQAVASLAQDVKMLKEVAAVTTDVLVEMNRPKKTKRTVEYGADGRITGSVEEEIE